MVMTVITVIMKMSNNAIRICCYIVQLQNGVLFRNTRASAHTHERTHPHTKTQTHTPTYTHMHIRAHTHRHVTKLEAKATLYFKASKGFV